MKRIATLAVAGMMAVMLTACGQQAPKKPEVNAQETTSPEVQQQAAPAQTEGAATGAQSQE